MHEYRPGHDDYMFTLYYQDKKIRLRVKQYHSGRGARYYHIFANNRVLDVKFNTSKNTLTEELQHGQPPLPVDFIRLLEKEFLSL